MQTTSATKMQSNVAVHTISFRGKAGAIFVLLCLAIALFLVGFVTVGWARKGNERMGLWENCTCEINKPVDWLIAVETMMSISLICLLISLLLIAIYMCVHTVSKNSTIVALVFFCFISFIFMLIGYVIYAVKKSEEENWQIFWSFGVTVLSSIFCFIAGVVSIIQLRSAGVWM